MLLQYYTLIRSVCALSWRRLSQCVAGSKVLPPRLRFLLPSPDTRARPRIHALCRPGGRLQLLVFKLALQLLGLDQLAHRLVEVVLVDGVSVVLDGEQAPAIKDQSVSKAEKIWTQALLNLRLGHHVAQVGAVQPVAHLDHALKVNFAVLGDTGGVDLEDLETADLVGQGDLDLAV